MPGFAITGTEGRGPSNTQETFRTHRWRVQKLGPIRAESDPALFLAKELQLPNFSVDQDTVTGASLVYKYAKNINFEDVTISFYDTEDIISELKGWRDTIWTPEEGLRESGSYKDTSIFLLLDGSGETLRTFTLINSWPKKISHGPLSYTSSDIKYVQVTLAYDWATEQ